MGDYTDHIPALIAYSTLTEKKTNSLPPSISTWVSSIPVLKTQRATVYAKPTACGGK